MSAADADRVYVVVDSRDVVLDYATGENAALRLAMRCALGQVANVDPSRGPFTIRPLPAALHSQGPH